MRCLIDGDAARRRLGLQACRKIRRLADHRLLLRGARSDQVADDDEPRGDADAALQRRLGGERSHRGDEFERRPYRALGVIFVRLRISEIDERTVAHVLGDEPAEALDALRNALLIARDDLEQVLGIHARRKRRRTDEVREHHGDLTALGRILRRFDECRGSRDRRRMRRLFGPQSGDRIE